MIIRKQLLVKHSRANADTVERMVLANRELLIELMVCFFSDETTVAQRAAQVVGNLGRLEPDSLLPWLPEIVEAIENPVHEAVRRNGVRYFSELNQPLPTKLEKKMIRLCQGFVADPKTKCAVGAFAMQFVADRADGYPAEAQTLCRDLQDRIPTASVGFQNRARKILSALADRN